MHTLIVKYVVFLQDTAALFVADQSVGKHKLLKSAGSADSRQEDKPRHE